MEINQRLQRAIDFIESNLCEDLSIKEIAFQACFSVYHFQRLFKKKTGLAVMEYVRKRRLSVAAYRLCLLERQVIDIAYDFRFSHEQSFIRSFKNEYNITPASFRKNKNNIIFFNKLSLLNEQYSASDITPFVPTYFLQHSLKLAGKKYYFHFEENNCESICFRRKSMFIKQYMDMLLKNCKVNNLHLYSLIKTIPHDYTGAYFILGIPIEQVRAIPPEMEIYNLPLHINLSISDTSLKNIHRLRFSDLSSNYDQVHNYLQSLSQYYHNPDVYSSYTKVNLKSLDKTKTHYSINLPVIENC